MVNPQHNEQAGNEKNVSSVSKDKGSENTRKSGENMNQHDLRDKNVRPETDRKDRENSQKTRQ
jgi:hypothetical protein